MYNNHYQEKLPCGGTLKVNKSRWEIEYYYPGIDRRYNGEFFTIYEAEIERIIQALNNNFEKFMSLRDAIPSGGDYHMTGEMEMKISVGGILNGIRMHHFQDIISSREQLKARLDSFEYAKNRAAVIQKALASI